MNISENTIDHLKVVVSGDVSATPYMTGPMLVKLFNRYGFNVVYGSGFPARNTFVEEKIRELNGKPLLKDLIEEIVDARRFIGKEADLDAAAEHMNNFLKFDGYLLQKSGEFYRIHDGTGSLVKAATIETLSHEFVKEQIVKCNEKIIVGDYDGAITNARSLTEAIFIEVVEVLDKVTVDYNGNLGQLYKTVKKSLKLNVKEDQMPDSVIQILSGLNSIVHGLSGISNSYADRHATKLKPSKHHAKLAVNCAISICDFVIDSKEYQKSRT